MKQTVVLQRLAIGWLGTLCMFGWSQDTSLHMAALSGDTAQTQSLIQVGVDVNGRMTRNWTPLMVAAKYGHTEVMDLLIKNKAEIDLLDQDGNSALILAVTSNQVEAVKLLLQRNADALIVNNKGLNAVQIARLSGFTEIQQRLETYLAPKGETNESSVAKNNGSPAR